MPATEARHLASSHPRFSVGKSKAAILDIESSVERAVRATSIHFGFAAEMTRSGPASDEYPLALSSEFTSSQILSALAINPGRRVSFSLNLNRTPPGRPTRPPAAATRATPAATSHSCFGESVQVAFAIPA